jgi:hypothetical protein
MVGEVREMIFKVPLSVSTAGLAATLAMSGCKEFFAGWMEKFGNPMYFCGPPT